MATGESEAPFVKVRVRKSPPPCFGSGKQGALEGGKPCRGCGDEACPAEIRKKLRNVALGVLVVALGAYWYVSDTSPHEMLASLNITFS